jgi:hypothetical protein
VTVIGDGADTSGNNDRIKEFVETGFGNTIVSAVMMGDESQKQVLAHLFGEDNTSVASTFDELMSTSMEQFQNNVRVYLKRRRG